VDDPEFDLDRHLRSVTLDDAEDPDALNRAVVAATHRQFDRDHSLWGLTLVSGGSDGRQAIVLAMHHSLGDGAALTTTIGRLFSDEPPDQDVAPVPWRPERPTRLRLAAKGLADWLKLSTSFPRLVGDTRRGLKARKQQELASAMDGLDWPSKREPLNPGFTPSGERVFAVTQLELSDFRLVRKAAEVGLNDVLMGVVGIAFRRYLLARGQLPEVPLTSGVMVSTEAPGGPVRQSENHIGSFITTLATQIEDPWEQLQAIAATGAELKLRYELGGVDILDRWMDLVPPAIAGPSSRRVAAKGRKGPPRVLASTVVSNMRGAPPFRLAGSTVDGSYPIGQVLDTMGVFVVGNSYGDHFDMSVLANPTEIERPDELASAFNDALADLVALATQQAATPQHDDTDRPLH
jgi:WS/DGAT/MGAT family acyltransferase